jgi:hypothetical protein
MDACIVASGVGENGTAEFTASEVGDNLLAFFFALVRTLPDAEMFDLFEACASAP